ncbi:unnamed protein product, partial [Ectocarpus sp. 4 AP-2014]
GEWPTPRRLVVVLNQACEGGENRWFASTLELQRVSLGFCEACRSVRTLTVRVGRETPLDLRCPRHRENSGRIPLLYPVCFKW